MPFASSHQSLQEKWKVTSVIFSYEEESINAESVKGKGTVILTRNDKIHIKFVS